MERNKYYVLKLIGLLIIGGLVQLQAQTAVSPPLFPDTTIKTLIEEATTIRAYHLKTNDNESEDKVSKDSLMNLPINREISRLYTRHIQQLKSFIKHPSTYKESGLIPKSLPNDLGFEFLSNDHKLTVILAVQSDQYHIAKFYLPNNEIKVHQLTIEGRNNFIKLARSIFPREYLMIKLLPEEAPVPDPFSNNTDEKEKSPNQKEQIYVVKKGEKWKHISRKLNVSKSDLRVLNPDLKNLKKGNKIRIPLTEKQNTSTEEISISQ